MNSILKQAMSEILVSTREVITNDGYDGIGDAGWGDNITNLLATMDELDTLTYKLDELELVQEILTTSGINQTIMVGLDTLSEHTLLTDDVSVDMFTTEYSNVGIEYAMDGLLSMMKTAVDAVIAFITKILKFVMSIVDSIKNFLVGTKKDNEDKEDKDTTEIPDVTPSTVEGELNKEALDTLTKIFITNEKLYIDSPATNIDALLNIVRSEVIALTGLSEKEVPHHNDPDMLGEGTTNLALGMTKLKDKYTTRYDKVLVDNGFEHMSDKLLVTLDGHAKLLAAVGDLGNEFSSAVIKLANNIPDHYDRTYKEIMNLKSIYYQNDLVSIPYSLHKLYEILGSNGGLVPFSFIDKRSDYLKPAVLDESAPWWRITYLTSDGKKAERVGNVHEFGKVGESDKPEPVTNDVFKLYVNDGYTSSVDKAVKDIDRSANSLKSDIRRMVSVIDKSLASTAVEVQVAEDKKKTSYTVEYFAAVYPKSELGKDTRWDSKGYRLGNVLSKSELLSTRLTANVVKTVSVVAQSQVDTARLLRHYTRIIDEVTGINRTARNLAISYRNKLVTKFT